MIRMRVRQFKSKGGDVRYTVQQSINNAPWFAIRSEKGRQRVFHTEGAADAVIDAAEKAGMCDVKHIISIDRSA